MTNEKIDELYVGVGQALTAWATVEFAMCRVYCQAASPTTYHPIFGSSVSARSFWCLHSLQDKLRITDETCRATYFFGDWSEKWGRLREKIKAKNRVRNKIAHGMVVSPSAASVPEKDVYLQPFPFSKSDGLQFLSAGTEMEHPPLRTTDLVDAAKNFSALSRNLRDFTFDIFAHYHPSADINVWPIGVELPVASDSQSEP